MPYLISTQINDLTEIETLHLTSSIAMFLAEQLESISTQIEGLTKIETVHLISIIMMTSIEQSENSCLSLEHFESHVYPLVTSDNVVAVLRSLDNCAMHKQ